MKTVATIHAIAQNDAGDILLLQRAQHRDRPAKWNCITGFIQERESAEDAAMRELKEETNLAGNLIKTSTPHWVEHDETRWIIVPSLISVSNIEKLQIDKTESQAHKWIRSDDPTIQPTSSLHTSLIKLGLRTE